MWKCLVSRCTEEVHKRRGNFLSLSALGYGSQEVNFRMVRLHLKKLVTWSNRNEDWKNMNSLFQWCFLCHRRPQILRSLIERGRGKLLWMYLLLWLRYSPQWWWWLYQQWLSCSQIHPETTLQWYYHISVTIITLYVNFMGPYWYLISRFLICPNKPDEDWYRPVKILFDQSLQKSFWQ